MSRAANAPNPSTLDTGQLPAANRTRLVTADDLFAAGARKMHIVVTAVLQVPIVPPPPRAISSFAEVHS